MTELYRFSDPAGLDQKFWHSYVPYAGAGFLASWAADRQCASALLPPPAPPPPAAVVALSGPAPYAADDVTDWLWVALPGGDARAQAAFARLLGRFEVVRKVAPSYHDDFRPVDTVPRGPLSAHVRLTECFLRAHEADGFLGTLNVTLKAIDTLIALAPAMDEDLAARLHGLILGERRAIATLAAKVGVDGFLPC